MGLSWSAVPIQTTASTNPASTFGAAVFFTAIVVVAVDRFTDIDVFGTIESLLPSPSASSGGVAGFLTSMSGVTVVGVAVFTMLVASGVLTLPAGSGLQIIIVVELIGVYAMLQVLDVENTLTVFAIVASVTAILGLSAMGEPVIGAIAQSPVFPLIAIGGLGLGAYGLYLYRKDVNREQRPRIVIRREK